MKAPESLEKSFGSGAFFFLVVLPTELCSSSMEHALRCRTSLSDDLLDVYFDLRRGLELWDQEVPKAAAIWEWRFAFDTHWGDHAIDALRALHRACRQTAC